MRNPDGTLNQASITDRYDISRDCLVNAADFVLARDNATSPFAALRRIWPPVPGPPAAEQPEGALAGAAGQMAKAGAITTVAVERDHPSKLETTTARPERENVAIARRPALVDRDTPTVNRLTHRIHILEANGVSYRLSESRRRLKKSRSSRRTTKRK